MSIWGKIIGGAIGFGVGGPIGALIGVVAGHLAVDKQAATFSQPRLEGGGPWSQQSRQTVFAVAVVVLAAKLAKVDGHVSRDEVAALKRLFHVPANASGTIGAIFNEAKKDARGFEPYARQVAAIFARERTVLEELLAALLMIAHADGVYHPNERAYLAEVAQIFGFSEVEFSRIEATFTHRATPEGPDPYEILGVSRQASDAEIKKAYRKLLQENHPDKLMAQGLPEDFIEVANRKMAAINAAYDRVKAERGLT